MSDRKEAFYAMITPADRGSTVHGPRFRTREEVRAWIDSEGSRLFTVFRLELTAEEFERTVRKAGSA